MGEESVTITPMGEEKWIEEFRAGAKRWAKGQDGACMCLGNCEDCGFHQCHGCLCAFIPLIHRVAAEARYEGAKSCADAIEIARPYNAQSWDAEDPIGRAKAETLSFCSEKISKAAQEYADSLKPKV